MANKRKRKARARTIGARTRPSTAVRWWQQTTLLPETLLTATLAVLALMHLASVDDRFRVLSAAHRWLMTYSDGFHRRGLVGTIFQFFAGDQPRQVQYDLASRVSALGTYLFFAIGFALFFYAAARIRDRALRTATLGFATLAFINPMWATCANNNGYLDWLAGLCVILALAAFAFRRPWLSGAVAAVGIVAYWGTLFIWLPLGFLIFCVLARDVFIQDDALPPPPPRCQSGFSPRADGVRRLRYGCRRSSQSWSCSPITTTRRLPN